MSSRRVRGTGSVRLLASGRWQARTGEGVSPGWTFDSKSDAERWLLAGLSLHQLASGQWTVRCWGTADRTRVPGMTFATRQEADAWAASIEATRQPIDGDAVVYYIRFAGRVKIGTTTCLASRLRALPVDELLATEPGGVAVERCRHRQFADVRVVGEWFTFSAALREHIDRLARVGADAAVSS